jgi:hypothetical protein
VAVATTKLVAAEEEVRLLGAAAGKAFGHAGGDVADVDIG